MTNCPCSRLTNTCFLPGAKLSIENSLQISKNASVTIREQSQQAKRELGELLAEIEERISEAQPELQRSPAVGESNATSKHKAKLNDIEDKLAKLNSMVGGSLSVARRGLTN